MAGYFSGYSVQQQKPQPRYYDSSPTTQGRPNNTQPQTQTMNPYAAYQQSNRNVGWPSGQTAQGLQQEDWGRNYQTLMQMGTNPMQAGVFAGAPSQQVPLIGLQQSESNRVADTNRQQIQEAIQRLQQGASGVTGSPLASQVTSTYQNLLNQGSSLNPQMRQQIMERDVTPGANAAYQAQLQMAQGMSPAARDASMGRAQEQRQNRLLDAQRSLSIEAAQRDYMERLQGAQAAGGYANQQAEQMRPYLTQESLLRSTAAQEQPADYSGLSGLVGQGQSLTRYQPGAGTGMMNYSPSYGSFGFAGGGNQQQNPTLQQLQAMLSQLNLNY